MLRAWMSGLCLWDWVVMVVARQAGGWRKGVQERGRCSLAEHQGSLSQFASLAARFGRSQFAQRSLLHRCALPGYATRLTVPTSPETSDHVLPGRSILSFPAGLESLVLLVDPLRFPTRGLLHLLSGTMPLLRELRLTILMLSHATSHGCSLVLASDHVFLLR